MTKASANDKNKHAHNGAARAPGARSCFRCISDRLAGEEALQHVEHRLRPPLRAHVSGAVDRSEVDAALVLGDEPAELLAHARRAAVGPRLAVASGRSSSLRRPEVSS